MAVRRIRTESTGSATIAVANNAPTGVVNNNGTSNAAVLTVAEFTTFVNQYNALLAAAKAHGIVNAS
jgi:hypothetical protein